MGLRAFFIAFFGTLLGALIGFGTYWIGAALIAFPVLVQLPPHELAQELQRPLSSYTYWEVALVSAGAVTGLAISRYRWRAAGLVGFLGLFSLAVGYVAYAWWVSLPGVPADARWLSYVLLAAEAGLLALVLLAAFYSLDVATRRRWDRLPGQRPFDGSMRPKVALMVPIYNEPAEMVEQTLAHLVRQDYPKEKLVVMLLDDSTEAGLGPRLKTFCENIGAVYVRRPQRNGFKAGAINHATRLLDDDVEAVGIIDADYWVNPDWLHSVVGYFVDPTIGFIQTPQDYRNKDESFLTRQYHRAEAYFYHAMMPSRNEENAIIFCGTMGLIRRTALEEVHGFAEDQICEDAEISVRLVAAGWNSLYVDHGFGKGLMPATFDAYKKQFHRWAFGNVKILFSRGWMILRSHMSRRQKLDYIVSNLHWFDGIFIAIVAFALLYVGLGPVLGYEAVTYHQREVKMLALVPALLLVDSFIRLHLVLKKAGCARLRDAFLVQGMWFAIKYTNLVAVLKASLGFKAPFVRTPKDVEGKMKPLAAVVRAVRVTKFETVMATLLFTVAGLDVYHLQDAGAWHMVLPVWLAMYGLFFTTAPLYAYLSYRTLNPLQYTGIPLHPAAAGKRNEVRFVRIA